MAGEARSSQLLLSTGTIMLGPQDKLMELSPELHSIGLVKNVTATADPQFVEMTQGVQAVTVMSVATAIQAKITAEVYEFTARNLAYGVGLDASGASYDPITDAYSVSTAITTGGSTVHLGTGEGSDFTAGDYLVIQDTTQGDYVHVGKVASVATDVITLATGFEMPTSAQFATGSTVIYKVHSVDIGSQLNATLGCKIVGQLPATEEPVTLIYPKVKITKGFGVSFNTQNFSNLPFEITPYALLPADPYYSEFGGKKVGKLLTR